MFMYNFIDLFCGCGGLSLGFQMAGFNPVAGIDFNAAAINTYKLNFTKAKALCKDILTMNEQLIYEELGNLSDIDAAQCF